MKDWKNRAKALKREVHALYLCSRHPNTPLYAKLFALLVVSYALSPIDLIPDFIPVLGYLDDLVLIPLGVMLLVRMIPKDVLSECRLQAQSAAANKPRRWVGAIIIVFIWIVAIYLAYTVVRRIIPA